MAKSYAEKSREDWKRENKERLRDRPSGKGAASHNTTVPYLTASPAKYGNGGSARGGASSSKGSGGSERKRNTTQNGSRANNEANSRAGVAWVQNGKVNTWNNAESPKTNVNSHDKAVNTLREAFGVKTDRKRITRK